MLARNDTVGMTSPAPVAAASRRRVLRTVFVHPSDELYGADRVILQVLANLGDEDKQHVELWVPTDLAHREDSLCREVESLGVRVRHVDLPILRRAYLHPRRITPLLRRLWSFRRELRRHRPEAVYCTTSAALLTAPIARLCGVRLVIGHIQEIWSPSERRILSAVASSCHRLIAVSQLAQSQLPASLDPRCAVVENATGSPRTWTPLEGRSGALRFVVASRWSTRKGHRTLLDAWERAGSPGILTILGGPPPTGEWTDVPALRERLTDPASVEVVGEVVDVDSYLEQADVVVIPSDAPESFGLVAIEAFARGRPVVASAAGGLVEVVRPGHDGWLFPAGDAEALAALLGGIDRATAQRAGRMARLSFESRFTVDRYVSQWRKAAGIHGDSAT